MSVWFKTGEWPSTLWPNIYCVLSLPDKSRYGRRVPSYSPHLSPSLYIHYQDV
jgi:hypothetical protein